MNLIPLSVLNSWLKGKKKQFSLWVSNSWVWVSGFWCHLEVLMEYVTILFAVFCDIGLYNINKILFINIWLHCSNATFSVYLKVKFRKLCLIRVKKKKLSSNGLHLIPSSRPHMPNVCLKDCPQIQ